MWLNPAKTRKYTSEFPKVQNDPAYCEKYLKDNQHDSGL